MLHTSTSGTTVTSGYLGGRGFFIRQFTTFLFQGCCCLTKLRNTQTDSALGLCCLEFQRTTSFVSNLFFSFHFCAKPWNVSQRMPHTFPMTTAFLVQLTCQSLPDFIAGNSFQWELWMQRSLKLSELSTSLFFMIFFSPKGNFNLMGKLPINTTTFTIKWARLMWGSVTIRRCRNICCMWVSSRGTREN